MSLPPLTPLPPLAIRLSIAPEEWEACLDTWLTLGNLYLRLPSKAFSTSTQSSLSPFLQSFYRQVAMDGVHDQSLSGPKAQDLRKLCFMLLDRMISENVISADLLDWEFVCDVCYVHGRNAALARLMNSLWKRKSGALEPVLWKRKAALTGQLESPAPASVVPDLTRVASIIHASPEIGVFFLTGSDFLDALAGAYTRVASDDERSPIVSVAYHGLISLLKFDPPNISALSDDLFGLKAQADKESGRPGLLADLVTNTPLVSKLRHHTIGGHTERLLKLAETLENYRTPSIARPVNSRRREPGKGKGRVLQRSGELHIHRMSLVTQVQDLFPELGSGFVLHLLDEYNDDVEQVTAHLLDDSLPAHLKSMDRTEQAPIFDDNLQEHLNHLAPPSTPPTTDSYLPDRHNAYDDDELLAVDASRLHIGKKEKQLAPKTTSDKSAILSALAAFELDDDENDDTYDVEDVGGTVDTAHPDGEPDPAAAVIGDENDMALFSAYKASPDLFGRTFDVRRGQARMALKAETGMTDEAIEGWAIMLQRDPRKLRRLEERYADFDGRQTLLQRTAYRESADTEDSDAPGSGTDVPRGGYRGRGSRGRGRGRGGSVAGPSGDPSTANAQRRKEANKSSRANHNRRDQRARKMARGGFAG